MKKILILSGNKKTNNKFKEIKNSDITIASFTDIYYIVDKNNKYQLMAGKYDIADFDVVYIRVVGGFREQASIVSYYCKKYNIPIQDPIYIKQGLGLVPIFKGMETLLLADAGIKIPITGFASLKNLEYVVSEQFKFPCVIKDTEGMQAKGVYLVKNQLELKKLCQILQTQSNTWHKKYIFQEFIHASHRHRIFVLGEQVLAGFIRPMRWFKQFNNNIDKFDSKKLDPIPTDEIQLSLKAAKAVGLGIAGVDLITEDKINTKYIMEVNYEPQWQSLAADNNINVEEHIAKYLESIAK